MKQPKVKLFGNIYQVKNIEWNKDTGEIDHIIYIYPNGETNLILQFDKVDYGHEVKDLTEPATHPHDRFVRVPSFESVLIIE